MSPNRVPVLAEFAVTSQREGSCHRLAAAGELDLASAPRLERELRRIEETDAEIITVDLSGLTFIDSAGAHLLRRADLRSRANGSRLRLSPAPPAVRRVLALLGVEKDLPFDAQQMGDPPSAERMSLIEAARSREHQNVDATSPTAPLEGEALTSTISAGIAGLYRAVYGHDRTTAHTFINDDVVVCVLKDILTTGESRLVRFGEGQEVIDGRVRFQTDTEDQFTAVIEKHTGRRVVAFLSANQTTPGCACELFFLEPEASTRDRGGQTALGGPNSSP